MDHSLYQKINSLPEELQKKVEEFVDSLKMKPPEQKNKRPLGLAAGKVHIHDDFDDPIPGFEAYTK